MVDITTFVGLRFIHNGNPYDPKASADQDSKYRIHTVEDSLFIPQTISVLSALTSGSTGVFYNQLAVADTRVYGCEIYGDSDALIVLELNDIVVGRDYMSIINRVGRISLLKPVIVETGQRIKISVTNKGTDTSDYEGVLISE